MEWLFVKTILSLGAVLGLMFVMVFLMKKYMTGGRAGIASRVEVEVLGQKGLHPKRSVVVLRVLGKVMVIGMSEAGMQTLSEIDDPDALAALAERESCSDQPPSTRRWFTRSEEKTSGGDFAGQLNKYFAPFADQAQGKSSRRGRKSTDGR